MNNLSHSQLSYVSELPHTINPPPPRAQYHDLQRATSGTHAITIHDYSPMKFMHDTISNNLACRRIHRSRFLSWGQNP